MAVRVVDKLTSQVRLPTAMKWKRGERLRRSAWTASCRLMSCQKAIESKIGAVG
jgi:hypothetical protein